MSVSSTGMRNAPNFLCWCDFWKDLLELCEVTQMHVSDKTPSPLEVVLRASKCVKGVTKFWQHNGSQECETQCIS